MLTLGINNNIPSDGMITVRFPPALQWVNDISTNHLLPIESVTCSVQDDGASGALLTGVSCVGELSTQTVTISFQFSSSAPYLYLDSTIILAISGLFSPPTT